MISQKTIRVLLVEDNPGDARLIREMLNNDTELKTTVSWKKALETLKEENFDIILLDLGLPESQGYKTFENAYHSVDSIPIIVLTGNDDEELAIKTVQNGAHDYLVKDNINSETLCRAVSYAIEWQAFRDEVRLKDKKVQHINLLLRAIRNVNQLIVREGNRSKLIKEACDLLIENRGYYNAWIALLDENQKVTEYAASGVSKEFGEIVEAHNSGKKIYCIDQALKQEKVIALPHQSVLCKDCPSCDTFKDREAMTIRLEHAGKIFGIMTVSVLKGIAEDEEDQGLFKEVARDIALALNSIQETEQRRESETTLATIFQSMKDGILVADEESLRFVNANESICQMLGYSGEEIKELSVQDIHPAEDFPYVVEQFQRQLKGEIALAAELPVKRKDGSVFYADINSVPAIIAGRKCLLGVFRDITERKEAEEALWESEQRHKVAQSVAHIGHWELRPEVGTPVWSEEIFHIFGMDPNKGEPSFVKHGEFIYPEDWPLLNQAITKASKEGVPFNLEFQFYRPDNSLGWMHAIGTSVKDDKGKIIKIFGTAQDITERRQGEEALRTSEERYRSLVESISDVIFARDEKGIVTYISPVVKNMIGYEPGEIVGEHFLEFVFPGDHEMLIDAFAELSRGIEQQNEYRLIAKNGSIKWVRTMTNPIISEGSLVSARGTIVDITERKIAELALHESREKLAGIIQAIPDFMSIIDEDYNLIWANEAINSTYSLQAIGGKCYAIYHHFDQPCENCLVRKVIADGKMRQQEAETVSATGEKIHQLSIASVASRYPDGRPKTVIEISRDITEHKKLEEQFRQSQKMEAIGKLAGGVAHDFNNLLTVISGNASLAMMTLKPEDKISLELEEIAKASRKAATLTTQLLAFSRKSVTEKRVLDFNTIIADMDKMLHRMIREDVKLTSVPAKDLWRVKVDPGHMEQIVMNLVVNARDAMPEGGVLEIKTKNVIVDKEIFNYGMIMMPGKYIKLTVRDEGCGMTEEVKTQIFDPFFTTKGVGEGTGLGLSTVFGNVRQNEGHIIVESEPNKGTRFEIYFPIAEGAIESNSKRTAIDDFPRGSETILIVEDEADVRRTAVAVLKRLGYKIIESDNGEKVYAKLRDKTIEHIDILVTDVVMPNMSGIELVDKIRKFQPELPVLYMSGYPADYIVKRGGGEVGYEFIRKPFSPMKLAKTVREILDRKNHPKT